MQKSRTEENRRGDVSWSSEAFSHFIHKNLWGRGAGWNRLPWFSPLVPSLELINLFKASSISSRTNWDFRIWVGCKFRDPGFKEISLLIENRWGKKNKEIKENIIYKHIGLGEGRERERGMTTWAQEKLLLALGLTNEVRWWSCPPVHRSVSAPFPTLYSPELRQDHV